jgi:anti-sigma-K factor RskA
MKGNELMPEASVISYVNHKNRTVIVNASGLPELPSDKDYQLWADVEGVMIDMGVIPKKSEMIAMTYIEDAESLNITIEPAGGNDHPTVSQLITNVYLDAVP